MTGFTNYTGTGVLNLTTVTPVIHALFSDFHLNAEYPGDGQAYIGMHPEETSGAWVDLLTNLEGLTTQLGLTIKKTDDRNVYPSVIDEVKDTLLVLAEHFIKGQETALFEVIEPYFGEDSRVDLAMLFTIAQHFDDGHGLQSMRLEGSWSCEQPVLSAFSGDGVFQSKNVCLYSSSAKAQELGQRLDNAFSGQNLGSGVDEGARHILNEINNLFDSVRDPERRELVRQKVAETLVQGLGYQQSFQQSYDFATTSDEISKIESLYALGYEFSIDSTYYKVYKDGQQLTQSPLRASTVTGLSKNIQDAFSFAEKHLAEQTKHDLVELNAESEAPKPPSM